MKLDLKQFQKIKSEKDHTVMQHPKGHKIHVDHSALSDDERKALHALPFAKMENKKKSEPMNMAKGGSVLEQIDSAQAGQVPQDIAPIQDTAQLQGFDPAQVPAEHLPEQPAQNPLVQASGMGVELGTQALAQELQGQQSLVQPQQQEHAQIASAAHQEQKKQMDIQSQAANRLQEYEKHMSDLQDDASKHKDINVDRYIQNMSTGRKVTTALGMLISGLGGNVGENNSVIKFINQQIQHDINAQQKDFDNRDSLLKRYTEAFKSRQEAADFLGAQSMRVMALKLQEIGAKSNNAQTQAKADIASAQLLKQSTDMLTQSAMKHAQLRQAFDAQSGAPGGQPSTPQQQSKMLFAVPKEEQGEATKELREQQNLDRQNQTAIDTFDKVSKLQTFANRAGSPVQSKAQLKALWGPMIDKITKESTGRVVPITVELFSGLEPSVLDNEETAKIKREKFLQLLEQGRSAPTLDKYNIPKSLFNPLKAEEPVRGEDGKMYVKQGNYMVPVKDKK